jgi:hypothetical protein
MHAYKSNCNYKHLEIADSCFTGGGILRRRMTRHGKHKAVSIAPKSVISKIIKVKHGDVMTGLDSKIKPKKDKFLYTGSLEWK